MFKKQQEEDDFRKRREEYAVGIRRTQREDQFNKRRNMGLGEKDASGATNKQENTNIIDQRYRKEIQEMIDFEYDNSMFDKLVGLAFGADVLEMHRGIIGLRKLLANDYEPPVQRFIDAGMIQKSFQFISQKQFPQLKLEAVWAMTNVASGESEHCEKLVQKGAIEKIVSLLIENQKGVVDQAIWAMGNIAADQTLYRDKILKLGGMNALITIVENTPSKATVKNGIWAMTNLCRGTPYPNYDMIKNATQIIAKALLNGIVTSKDIISDCCWSLSYMCEGPKSRIQRVMTTGVLPIFFKYAKDSYSGLYIPSIRIIGNFSTGNQLHTQQLLKNGILDLLKDLIKHPKTSIRREACWIASNIAAGTASQVQTLLSDKQLLKLFVQAFETDVVEVRRQICWIFSNFGHLGPKKIVIGIYLEFDIMRNFINLLHNTDVMTLDPTLECLYKILVIGMKGAENGQNVLLQQMLQLNGGEILQQLQHHESMKIYERVVKILTKFFVVDEGDQLM